MLIQLPLKISGNQHLIRAHMKTNPRLKDLEEENARLKAELRKYTLEVGTSQNDKLNTDNIKVISKVENVFRHKKSESELRRTVELLKTITEGTDDMIAAQDIDFRYIFFNKAYKNEFRKLWGNDLEPGTSMVEAMAPWPDEQEKAKSLWSRALGGESFNIIMEFGPESERQYYDLRFHPLRDSQGRQFGAAHIIRNVTEQILIQKKLNQSESQFRQLAESIPQLIFITRPDGYHEYFNKRWYDYTGAEPGETDGDGWTLILHPDDYKHTLEVWQNSLRTGTSFKVECRLKSGTDGSYNWFLCRAMPLHNEIGEITKWLGTCTDIQELKTTQQALQESQERYHLVNRATFDIIWDWDILADRMEWNEAIEAATGRSRSEMTSSIQVWYDHIHPEDRAAVINSMHQAIDCGEDSWQYEYRFGPSKGEWRDYLDRGFIARDKTGKAYRMIGSMMDLTDQKFAAERVKKSENLLQKVLEVLPAGVFVSDEQGRIAQTNPACEIIWGGAKHVPIERFVEYKGWCRDTGKRIDAGDWALSRAFRNGEVSLNEEIDIECFDGTRKTIRNSAVPVRNDLGEIISAVAVVLDITEEIRAKRALKESEEKFRTMADNIAPFTWMADNRGEIFWYNKRWFDYTGTNLEEMRGWGWTKVHHPDHVDRVVKKVMHCRDTGSRWEDTFPLRGKDGNYRWFLSRAVPIRDENGEILRWFGTNTDITDLKETQKSLDSERELLQAIFNSIPVMIAIFQPELSSFKFNKAFKDITGWTGAEDNIVDLIYPDKIYREKVIAYMNSLETGFRDFVMKKRDGSEIEAIWANVRLNDYTLIGIGIDISERKALEEKLREQALMLDQVQDAIVTVGERGQIRYMNDAALKLYKLDRDSLKQRTSIKNHSLIQFNDSISEEEMYRKLAETGNWHGENYFISGGRRIWVDIVASSIKDGGKFSGTILAIRNITERKKLQDKLETSVIREKRTSELFENLLYIAAHDLKGPIANMFLALNLIDRMDNPAMKIKIFDIFKPLVTRLENTIKGLTGILQIQKTDESAVEKVYFENILNEVILDHKDTLYEGTVVHNFSNKPSLLYIEPFLASIMKNLITNAIKYSRDNVSLKIEVETLIEDNGYILLRVSDNGIGIDMKKHGEQLFSPFNRFTPSKAEGTGIGLYLIKSIIEKNGGYIKVKSIPGKGTEFYCYLREYEDS
jgi:PAS domain S-box-containing protein